MNLQSTAVQRRHSPDQHADQGTAGTWIAARAKETTMTPLLSSRLSRCRTVAAPSCTLLLAVVAAVSTPSPTADRPLRESAPSFFRGKQIHRPASRPWRSEVALEIGKWPTAAAAGCARWGDAGTGGSVHRAGKSDTAASTGTVLCCGSRRGEEGQQIHGHVRASVRSRTARPRARRRPACRPAPPATPPRRCRCR